MTKREPTFAERVAEQVALVAWNRDTTLARTKAAVLRATLMETGYDDPVRAYEVFRDQEDPEVFEQVIALTVRDHVWETLGLPELDQAGRPLAEDFLLNTAPAILVLVELARWGDMDLWRVLARDVWPTVEELENLLRVRGRAVPDDRHHAFQEDEDHG